MASPTDRGVEALRQLKSTEPPLWLSPSVELSQGARAASDYLFSSLQPFCPKSPFDRLLLQGFDAEQIWQQIDLQTQPLVSHLRRELKWFEINREEISKLFGGDVAKKSAVKEESDGFVENGTGEGSEGFEDLEDEDEDEEDEEDEEEDEKEEGGGGDGIEDRFLKIKELEEFMEEDEEREYGGGSKRKSGGSKKDDDDDEEDEEDDIEGFSDDGSEDEDINARYEDFFGGKKGKSSKRKQNSLQDESNKLYEDNEENSEDFEEDSDEDDSSRELENGRDVSVKGHKKRVGDLSRDNDKEDNDESGHLEEPLSTHEKQLQKLRLKIEQMEKANLEPKSWTMQGEVTAAKRPKNSALEVDLDFEHNVRPAPVITEEVTTSLEDLIKKRILDGHFDDVQRMPGLLSKGPKEMKELDENKSKKGLADIYEEEYAQKSGLASAPLSFSDELKKEATLLFKTLCLKLDALSHFHFTPKPIIEEMSIQANVPALAMEEIAPVAVSDATMLAPEEVFAGKGDIKEEAELTQAEKRRRRANKKRRFKAERTKHGEKKARGNTVSNGKEES